MTRALERRPPARGPELRHVILGIVSALTAFGLTAGGCGTAAVGIEACRDIETARCEAAQYCGRIDDVQACQRFYRDHCLHGLAKGVELPADDQIADCVQTIERAGQCAKKDRFARLDQCEQPVTSSSPLTGACQIVLFPEWSAECSFLGPRGDLPPFPGSGGQGGSP